MYPMDISIHGDPASMQLSSAPSHASGTHFTPASKRGASSSCRTSNRNSLHPQSTNNPFPSPASKSNNMIPNLEAAAPASPLTPAPSPTPIHRLIHRRDDLGFTNGDVSGLPDFAAWQKPGMRQEMTDADEEADDMEAFIRSAKSYFAGLCNVRDRRRFMAEMLELCDNQLLSFVSDFISPRLKKDPFSMLPNELCLRVLSFIDDPKTLARASQVSTRWHELLNDDLTWKLLCDKHSYRRGSEDTIDTGFSFTQPQTHPTSQFQSASSIHHLPEHDSTFLDDAGQSSSGTECRPRKRQKAKSYRSHFKRKYLIDAAWRKGGRSISHHVTPDQAVVTSLHLTEKYIVVALDNAKIHIFSPEGNLLRSLKGHIMGVWAMVPWGDTLVSGGCDRDVRVWDMETGESLHKMRGHTSTIRCLKMYDSKTAISGSRDTTLRVWDIEKGCVKSVLQGHSASVRCLAIHGDTVVSGSYDATAKIWNVPEGRLVHTLEGHFSQIYAIAFDGQRVVTGSLDTSVRVWDPTTGNCLATLQGHTSLVGKLQMRGDTLVTGGSDGSIRVWSLSRFEPIHRLVAHDNSITSLQFDSTRIVSGGSDGCVKIWDLETGALVRELGENADAVWRVAFEEEKAVTMATRGGRTYMEVWDFSAPEDDDDEVDIGRRRLQAAAANLSDQTREELTQLSLPLPLSLPSSRQTDEHEEVVSPTTTSARAQTNSPLRAILGSAGYLTVSDHDMQDVSSSSS